MNIVVPVAAMMQQAESHACLNMVCVLIELGNADIDSAQMQWLEAYAHLVTMKSAHWQSQMLQVYIDRKS